MGEVVLSHIDAKQARPGIRHKNDIYNYERRYVIDTGRHPPCYPRAVLVGKIRQNLLAGCLTDPTAYSCTSDPECRLRLKVAYIPGSCVY